jgi:hypothetical protein
MKAAGTLYPSSVSTMARQPYPAAMRVLSSSVTASITCDDVLAVLRNVLAFLSFQITHATRSTSESLVAVGDVAARLQPPVGERGGALQR